MELLATISHSIFPWLLSGGEIDWGHHAGKAHLALSETVVLNKAVKRAKEMTKSG